MNALKARKIVDDFVSKIQKEHEEEHKIMMSWEAKKRKELWKKRSKTLITKINGFIKKAASRGDDYIWEPSETNPNGDSIVYLEESDQPIKELLMDYFRSQGFTVEDYMYGGMKITW